MKVLLISHNPVTTYNNMGKTFLSLFSAFKREELCQLYIYPTVPDVDCCGSYYRFTDGDALHSLIDGRVVGGEVFPNLECHSEFNSENEERFYRTPRNRKEIARLGRDMVWKLSNWNNTALNEWLDQQAPDLIFAAVGNQEMLYDMAMMVAKQRNIPLVPYVCDDYYYSHGNGGFIQRLREKRINVKIHELMRHAALTVTICQELTNGYARTFEVKAETVMTSPVAQVRHYTVTGIGSKHLVYMGNIEAGREQPLMELGRALVAENRMSGMAHTLDIYTDNKCPKALNWLASCPAICLHGFVTGQSYMETFDGADVFVHVESFEEKNRERVRYSISTKIIECLASGRPLLAYGPKDVASMAYLRRNKCAILAQSQEELTAAVENVLTKEQIRKSVVENALQTAKRESKNSQRLHKLFETVLDEYSRD